MTEREFTTLIQRPESDTLDFKATQYDFAGVRRDEQLRKRGLFAKDILSMKNTPRSEAAFIVLGVKCLTDGTKELTGLARQVDDALLQEQIASLVQPHPKFRYIPIVYQGKQFGVIEIPADRTVGPCLPTKDVVGAGLKARLVYIRRNSRNSEADHAESKYVWQWFNDPSSPHVDLPPRRTELSQPYPEVIVLIPGYAEWSGPGSQRASGTVTLVKGSQNVIVDTGVPTQRREILERLQANGLKPGDIDVVVITHGQSDHLGNNNLFPKAKFILDTDVSTGDEYTVHNFRQDAFHIDAGIYAIATPGHTDHDISVVAETANGTVVIAGDIFERDGDWQDRSWEAWSKKKKDQKESREKILRIADFIVPGHGDIFRSPTFAALELAPAHHDREQIDQFLRQRSPLISELARRFQTHWSRVDEERITTWLRQFGDYRSLQSVFPLLENIDYIDDAKITDIFADYFEKLTAKTPRRPVFSRLGGGKDSSSIVGYICSKVFDEKTRRDVLFENIEAAARTQDPSAVTLVLLDDTIGSGNQAITIFSEWLGVSPEEPKHVHRLSPEAAAWLRRTELRYFAFIGFTEGKVKLQNFLASQGIEISVQSAITMEESAGCFEPNSLIFDNPQVRLHAKKIAEEIGYQLFADREDWPVEKRRTMALGYEGAQKLIVFSYNTPNCTLPIFWKTGIYSGQQWLPLFPRRD